ncbi:MAG: hypothetical protein WAV11_03160 [Minisyncoccia bacterium]
MEKPNFNNPGQDKIQEYVDRIKAGEAKDSIINGLPPSFIKGIEEGLPSSEIIKEIDHSTKLKGVRESLGLENPSNKFPMEAIEDLVEEVSEGKRQAVKDLYKQLIENIDDSKTRENLYRGLFGEVYNKLRLTEGYKSIENEEEIWQKYLNDKKIPVRNMPSEWMYRGIFATNSLETQTRGSFNVNVTPELIDKLDEMIISGKIKANYKFGAPDTLAAPSERHDSITIYFLDFPTEENLQELSEIISPYVRGDSLLGKKIADGFYISELGSIKSNHIRDLVNKADSLDPALAKAIKIYTMPQRFIMDGKLKMSEAQYYAIKDVAKTFGYELSYDGDQGFEIIKS